MMKEAVRRVVDELNGESIESLKLQKRIAKHYADAIKQHGTPAEKRHLVKLKNLESVKPFTKLIRKYGYEPKQLRGLYGNVTSSGLGNKNPVMSSMVWELKKDSVEKTWNALSKYPPVSEAKNVNTLRDIQMKVLDRYEQMFEKITSHPLTPAEHKAIVAYYHQLIKYQLHKKAQKLKQKVESLGGSL